MPYVAALYMSLLNARPLASVARAPALEPQAAGLAIDAETLETPDRQTA